MTPNKIRVLLAEDHRIVREGFKFILGAQPDIECVGEAGDGRAGLSAALALKPDVVLLDVRLPDMDGFAVAGELAAGTCRAAVIVTSSSDDPLYPARATSSGARGFVAKHDVCGAALDRLIGKTS